MAFLAPAVVAVGEAAGAAVFEYAWPAVVDAGFSVGQFIVDDIIFGGEQLYEAVDQVALLEEQTAEQEGIIAEVNANGNFNANAAEMAEQHVVDFHFDEADSLLSEMAEVEGTDSTPGIYEALTQMRTSPEFRAAMIDKAAKALFVAGATFTTEQLVSHAYSYAMKEHATEDEILTHHEHITGESYMPSTKRQKMSGTSKKRSSGGAASSSSKRIRATNSNAVARRIPLTTTRHVYKGASFTHSFAGNSLVLPLINQWNGTIDTATGLSGGIATNAGSGSDGARFGDIITVKNIKIKVYINYNGATATILPNQKYNFYVFYDNDYDRKWPTPSTTDWKATNFFDVGSGRTDAFRTRNNLARFTLLKKASVDFMKFTQPFAATGTTFPNFRQYCDINVNTSKTITYDSAFAGAGGLWDTIRHGQLYLVVCAAEGTLTAPNLPDFKYETRIEYEP